MCQRRPWVGAKQRPYPSTAPALKPDWGWGEQWDAPYAQPQSSVLPPHQLLSPRLSPQSPDLWVSVALTSLLLTQLTHASPPMFSAFLFGGRERCNAEHNLRAHGFFPPIRTCLHFWGGQTTQTSPDSHCRLPGGAVPLHQALLRPQALQAVPERDLLLQASAGAAPFPPTPIPIGTAPHLGCFLFCFLTPKIHLFPAASAGST